MWNNPGISLLGRLHLAVHAFYPMWAPYESSTRVVLFPPFSSIIACSGSTLDSIPTMIHLLWSWMASCHHQLVPYWTRCASYSTASFRAPSIRCRRTKTLLRIWTDDRPHGDCPQDIERVDLLNEKLGSHSRKIKPGRASCRHLHRTQPLST